MSAKAHSYTTTTGYKYSQIAGQDIRTYKREKAKLYYQPRPKKYEKLAPQIQQDILCYKKLGYSLARITALTGIKAYTVNKFLKLKYTAS